MVTCRGLIGDSGCWEYYMGHQEGHMFHMPVGFHKLCQAARVCATKGQPSAWNTTPYLYCYRRWPSLGGTTAVCIHSKPITQPLQYCPVEFRMQTCVCAENAHETGTNKLLSMWLGPDSSCAKSERYQASWSKWWGLRLQSCLCAPSAQQRSPSQKRSPVFILPVSSATSSLHP